MNIKKKISIEEIEQCMSGNDWDFGNNILYEMCEKNPCHEAADVIIGKLWLIGRTYAAAIERRKHTNTGHTGDAFYFNIVAPKMLEIGKELDERIKKLNQYPYITEENLVEVIKTHQFLTKIFSEISQMEKRSLASKYLHFHVPHMFYIYDSRAVQSAKNYADKDKNLYNQLKDIGDKDYIALVARLFPLEQHIKQKYHVKVSPRMLDNLLLG